MLYPYDIQFHIESSSATSASDSLNDRLFFFFWRQEMKPVRVNKLIIISLCCLLGCDTVVAWRWIQVFRKKNLPPRSWYRLYGVPRQ